MIKEGKSLTERLGAWVYDDGRPIYFSFQI